MFLILFNFSSLPGWISLFQFAFYCLKMFSFALVFISLTVSFSLFFNYYCMTDKCQRNTQIKKKTTLNKREINFK